MLRDILFLHLPVVGTLIERLHEAWMCSHVYFAFKLVVKQIFYSTLHAAILTEALIQRSVMPHQRESKRICFFLFPENNGYNLKDDTLFLI